MLHQLHIADKKLPYGVACLKHTLLFSPSDPTPQESNVCTNSRLSGSGDYFRALPELRKRLYDTIADSPMAPRRPNPDIDDYEWMTEHFKSMSYLDQIALICLAAGLRECRAAVCLEYQEKLQKVVPVCHSWPGLRDWVLCIISCSLHTIRDIKSSSAQVVPGNGKDGSKQDSVAPMEDESKSGLSICRALSDHELLKRCWAHLTACIMLTTPPEAKLDRSWDLTGMPDAEILDKPANGGGSIGGPRPDQEIYSFDWTTVSSRSCPRFPRPNIYTQSFDLSQQGSAAGPSVDVGEVFQLVAWFRNIARNDVGGEPVNAPSWHACDFIPVSTIAVGEASGKIKELGFCHQRIWEVVKNSYDGVFGLVPLMGALEHFPWLRHKGHKSCTSGFCEYATQNFTSVTQLHKCPDTKKCILTTGKMFDQILLVAALEDDTMTTAWALDGISLVAKGKSYLAVSHVWSDGTGAGAWQAGQVNSCLWDFFKGIASSHGCDGVWWDTVCIPQDKAARSTALNNMHRNYTAAEYTVVHDLYLVDIEWKDDGSPCIALVLSPWFTRGWTALELLLSKRVFILFRQGDGYTLKDLDMEVLAQHQFLDSHAHWIATDAVKRLRHADNTFKSISDLLSVLQARYCSWNRDQSIIAGLMCGLTDHVELLEQDITKQVLLKIRKIGQNCLLHGLPTMSDPGFSWCPPRFIDIPSGGRSDSLWVQSNGTLSGKWEIWYIPSKFNVDRGMIWPSSTDTCVRTQVQWALQEPEKCVILTCDTYDSQGVLVRLKAYNDRPREDNFSYEDLHNKHLYCEYIGVVNVSPSEIRKPRFRIIRNVVIGYEPGMIDVGVMDWERDDFEYQRDKGPEKAELHRYLYGRFR